MSHFVPPRYEDIPSITQMVQTMHRTVAGLDKVKLRLAVALHRFMVAAALDQPWRPNNILIVGPTGGGKTYLLTQLLNSIPVIWTEAALTEFSDTGWTGRDLNSAYLGLTERHWREVREGKPIPAELHRERAARWGVMVFDEFDKLRTPKANEPTDRHVGKHLQFELLKFVEGTTTRVKASDTDPGFDFHTDHVLHIALGAFSGEPGRPDLTHVVMDRMHETEVRDHLYESVELRDLISYGFIPELIGRFATVIAFPPLKVDHLVRILAEQIVPVWQAKAQAEGITLQVDRGGMHTIASEASQHVIGGRALEPILDDWTWRSWAEAQPGDTIVLDATAAGVRHARLVRALAA